MCVYDANKLYAFQAPFDGDVWLFSQTRGSFPICKSDMWQGKRSTNFMSRFEAPFLCNRRAAAMFGDTKTILLQN
jgi:hypothetical protein